MKWPGAQVEHAFYERFAMRVCFALVVALHMPTALAPNRLAAPNGLARLVDLQFLCQPEVFRVSQYLLWAALLLYIARAGWDLVLPFMTLLSVAVGSVQNSQGAIGHHLQIVSLVLLAQTVAHFFSRFRPGSFDPKQAAGRDEDRVINWSQQAIAATYLVSGLQKLIHTGGTWFFQSPLVAVQIIKTTDQNYYDTLDPRQHNAGLALAEWMVQHPLLVGLILSSGLLLELSSPLLLCGRRWALAYGLALLLFHETVGRVMKLGFPYNEYLLWIYLVNLPFWTVAGAHWFGRSLRRPTANS